MVVKNPILLWICNYKLHNLFQPQLFFIVFLYSLWTTETHGIIEVFFFNSMRDILQKSLTFSILQTTRAWVLSLSVNSHLYLHFSDCSVELDSLNDKRMRAERNLKAPVSLNEIYNSNPILFLIFEILQLLITHFSHLNAIWRPTWTQGGLSLNIGFSVSCPGLTFYICSGWTEWELFLNLCFILPR